METYLSLLVGVVAGIVMGMVHFIGLWWTIRSLAVARHPGRRVLFSYLGRMGVLLAGLALVSLSGIVPTLGAVLGLLLSRRWVLHRTRPVPVR